jgi:hypothetical protein
MEVFSINISKYPFAVSQSGEVTSLYQELQDVSNGKYKEKVTECRDLYTHGDKVEYKKKKSTLPAVSFSGLFNGSHKAENIVSYSTFIILDIDAIDKTLLVDIKEKIFNDQYVACVWISPSGCGLKVLIKTLNEKEEHKKCFDTLVFYFSAHYKIEIDKSGSDVSRLCFVSYDKDLLIKNDFVVFDYRKYYVEFVSPPPIEDNKTIKLAPFYPEILVSEKYLFHGTENRNIQKNRDSIKTYIQYLKKTRKSITSNYNDWFRVACAISNSFTVDLGTKYFLELCRCDGALHDEYKSQEILEYCYRNRRMDVLEFSTIVYLMKKQGFVLAAKKRVT